jgi:hypothetical protein
MAIAISENPAPAAQRVNDFFYRLCSKKTLKLLWQSLLSQQHADFFININHSPLC